MSTNPYSIIAAAAVGVGAFAAGWFASSINKPPKNRNNPALNSQIPPSTIADRDMKSGKKLHTNDNQPYFEAPLTTHPSFPRSYSTEQSHKRITSKELTPDEYLQQKEITRGLYPGSSNEIGLEGPSSIKNVPHPPVPSHIPHYDHSHPWFEQEEENITYEDAEQP